MGELTTDAGATRYILGIDPGPTTSGLVVYKVGDKGVHGRVVLAEAKATLEAIREQLSAFSVIAQEEDVPLTVVVERTQAGPPSTAVVHTTEVVGRLMEACLVRDLDCQRYYRRQVLQALGCAKKGNKDSHVRNALLEIHGGLKEVAVGRKACPGPLYGVSSHAWQALGVVFAHIILPAFSTPERRA